MILCPIRARMAAASFDTPDILPNIAEVYRKKVERLAEALNQPTERAEAADAIRALIERVILTPGTKRGEINAMLHGEFGAILEWVGRLAPGQTKTPGSGEPGVMRSVVAGTRFILNLRSQMEAVLSNSIANKCAMPTLFRAPA